MVAKWGLKRDSLWKHDGKKMMKKIPIPGLEVVETGPTTFHDSRSERFLGFAHGLVFTFIHNEGLFSGR